MLRFIFFIVLFSSSLQADYSIDPPFFYGSINSGGQGIGSGTGSARVYTEFLSVSDICVYSTTNRNTDTTDYRNIVQNHSNCDADIWSKNTTYNTWSFNTAVTVGYADPEWSDCLFVNASTSSCQSSYPADFDTYVCNSELNSKWGNTINVCSPPPLCVGPEACEDFIFDLNGCQSLKDQAATDPYLDYSETPFTYVDNYNFSMSCGTASSDRVDTTDVTPDPWSDTVDPLISDSGDSGTPSSPTSSTPTSDPVPSGGSPNNSADAETQTIDDSNIVNSIDMLTTMINGQLNTIESTNNNINNSAIDINNSIDSVSSSLNAQTTMLNSQLNSIGDAIVNSNNDGAIINAINNTTQTNEDILDLLSADNSISLDPSGFESFDHQQNVDNYITSFDNSPVMIAMSNIANVVTFESPYCQQLSIDLTDTLIDEVISTDIHCDLFAENSGPLSLVMIVIWSFTGFRIFAGA
jgi:hypothetical protein